MKPGQLAHCLLFILVSLSQIVNAEGEVFSAPIEEVPDWATREFPSEVPMWKQIQQSGREPLEQVQNATEVARDELVAIAENNRSNFGPTKVGFLRKLKVTRLVIIEDGSASLHEVNSKSQQVIYENLLQTKSGDLIWSSSIFVEGSYRLRVQLAAIDLPQDAQLWVVGDSGKSVGPFGAELVDETGTLWTPSVRGPEITIVIQLPEASDRARFTISSVAEQFMLNASGQPVFSDGKDADITCSGNGSCDLQTVQELLNGLNTNSYRKLGPANGIEISFQQLTDIVSCSEEAMCFDESTYTEIEGAQRAVAIINFIKDGGAFRCSGGLINDLDTTTFVPYFLTANHCIDTADVAASMEAFFDYRPSTCGGDIPSLSSLPRVNGAKFLVAGQANDFALLELNGLPSGRFLLGWTTSAIAHGVILHRISHPRGLPQRYSQSQVDTGASTCNNLPRPNFIYQTQEFGVITGGSSGSPAMLDNGRIVGQNYGRCGPNYEDDCDVANNAVDASFANYFPQIARYLTESQAPDLIVDSPSVSSSNIVEGGSFDIYTKVRNSGTGSSTASTLRYFRSTDSTISTSDTALGTDLVGVLSVASFGAEIISVSAPSAGTYWVGACVDFVPNESNTSNNCSTGKQISVFSSDNGMPINQGMNDAWFDPETPGQGFFITVYPDLNLVFLAWFTYDTTQPTNYDGVRVGDPGHRWLTAQGPVEGNRAVLDVTLTRGGLFDDPISTESLSTGIIIINFRDCSNATLEYDLSDAGVSGTIQLKRLADDNVAVCESLNE